MNKKIKDSVQLTKISPKLTGNLKIVTNGVNDIWVDELRDMKSSPQRLDIYSSFGQAIKKYTSKYLGDLGNIHNNTFNYSLDTDFSTQYQNEFEMGVVMNNNPMYNSRFRIFSPLYINLDRIPTHFVIFKRRVNLQGELEDSKLFRGASCVKIIDLSKNVFGGWFQNHVNFLTKNRHDLDLYLNFDGRSTINGYDIKTGVFTQKYEIINFEAERTIYDFDRYITNIYERNNLIHPRFLNLEFTFDDESTLYEHYYYFGAYLYQDETLSLNYNNDLDLTLSSELSNEIQNGRVLLFSDSSNKFYKIDNSIGETLLLSPDTQDIDLSGKTVINSFNNSVVSSGSSSQIQLALTRQPFRGEKLEININDQYNLKLTATDNELNQLGTFKIGSNLEETKINFIKGLGSLLYSDHNTDFSATSYYGNILIYSNSSSLFWDNYQFAFDGFIKEVNPFFKNDGIDGTTYGYSPKSKIVSITKEVAEFITTIDSQTHYLRNDGTFHKINVILPYVASGKVDENRYLILLDTEYDINNFNRVANLGIDTLENIYKMSFATIGDLSTSTYNTDYGSSLLEFDADAYKTYLTNILEDERPNATIDRVLEIDRELQIINNTFDNLLISGNLQYLNRILTTEYDYFYENYEINTDIERVNNNTVRWSYSGLNDVRNNEMRVNVSKIFRRNFTSLQNTKSRDLKFYAFDWFLLGNGIPPYLGAYDKRGYINVVEGDFKRVDMDVYESFEDGNDMQYGITKKVGNKILAYFRGQIIELPPKYEGYRFAAVFRNEPTLSSTDIKIIDNQKYRTLTIYISKDLDDKIFLYNTNNTRFIDRSYFYMSERIYNKGGEVLKIPLTTEVKFFYDEIIPNSFELSDSWIRIDEIGSIFTISTPSSDSDLRNFFTVSTEQDAQILLGDDMVYCRDFVSVGFNSFECREIYYVKDFNNISSTSWADENNANVYKFEENWLKEEYIEDGVFFKINQRLKDARLYISFLDQTFAENFINEVSLSELKNRIEGVNDIEIISVEGEISYDTIHGFNFLPQIPINIEENITINETIDSDVTLYSSNLIGYEYGVSNDSYEISRYSGNIEPIIHKLNISETLQNTYYKGLNPILDYHIVKKGGANIIQDINREIVLIDNTKFFKKKLSLVENIFSEGRYKTFTIGRGVLNLDRFGFPYYGKSMLASIYPLLPKFVNIEYVLEDYIDDENIDLIPKFATYIENLIGDNIGINWYTFIVDNYYKVYNVNLDNSTNRIDRFNMNVTRLGDFVCTFSLKYIN